MAERVGFIFECGRGGPDYQVCKCLLERLNADIEVVARYVPMPRLLDECGNVARALLVGCERVVIQWDERPLWPERTGRKCWGDDRQRVLASLRNAGLDEPTIKERTVLLAIRAELEAWFVCDRRLIEAFVAAKKGGRRLCNRFGRYPHSDRLSNPKGALTDYFVQELGSARRYDDTTQAIRLAQELDLARARHIDSFQRFVQRVARIA